MEQIAIFLPVSEGLLSLSVPDHIRVPVSSGQPANEQGWHIIISLPNWWYGGLIQSYDLSTFNSWMLLAKVTCSESDCCNFWFITVYASTVLSCSAKVKNDVEV